MIRALLVDDSRAQREGWRLVLGTQPDVEVVGEAGDGAQALRVGECLQCHGSGHVHIDCEEHEVDDVVRGLPPTRRQLAVRRMMAGVGMCTDCFGAGAVAQIECDADRSPIRYAEVPCPTCTTTG